MDQVNEVSVLESVYEHGFEVINSSEAGGLFEGLFRTPVNTSLRIQLSKKGIIKIQFN